MDEKNDYGSEYSDEKFWDKVGRFAKTVGRDVIEKILTLYFCFKDPATPLQAKGIIVGALGYFILPTDAIPDFIPGVGFADDIGALSVALATIREHVTEDHKRRASEQVEKIFGDGE